MKLAKIYWRNEDLLLKICSGLEKCIFSASLLSTVNIGGNNSYSQSQNQWISVVHLSSAYLSHSLIHTLSHTHIIYTKSEWVGVLYMCNSMDLKLPLSIVSVCSVVQWPSDPELSSTPGILIFGWKFLVHNGKFQNAECGRGHLTRLTLEDVYLLISLRLRPIILPQYVA
jgi:hypothetical protein